MREVVSIILLSALSIVLGIGIMIGTVYMVDKYEEGIRRGKHEDDK